MSAAMQLYEVGLRDGLQAEQTVIPTEAKLRVLRGLVKAGLRRIELTSFVSPKAVPQMADAAQLLQQASTSTQAELCCLVITESGYERAVKAGARSVAVVVVLTEALCARNNRMTVADALATGVRLVRRSRDEGVKCRVYLSPAWVCPFEGPVPPARVVEAGAAMRRAGPCELALADTIGAADPASVGALCEAVEAQLTRENLAVHLHDTQALGLANAVAAMNAGIATIDTSIGGLGGCPFSPGAAGNLATEDAALLFEKMGRQTGVELAALWRVVDEVEAVLGRSVGGRTRQWWESHKRDARGGTRAREGEA